MGISGTKLNKIKVNNMILANGTKVFLVGGHYKDDVEGQHGTILTHRNSSRDGDSYIIEFGFPVGKVQVKAKFVREALTEVEPVEMPPLRCYLEGKWVVAPWGIKIFEEPKELKKGLNLSDCECAKNVLVTLVYEDFGTTVANVVFQGTYAVVPARLLVVKKDRIFGAES